MHRHHLRVDANTLGAVGVETVRYLNQGHWRRRLWIEILPNRVGPLVDVQEVVITHGCRLVVFWFVYAFWWYFRPVFQGQVLFVLDIYTCMYVYAVAARTTTLCFFQVKASNKISYLEEQPRYLSRRRRRRRRHPCDQLSPGTLRQNERAPQT